MILTPEQAKKRLESSLNLSRFSTPTSGQVTEITIHKGGNVRKPKLPTMERAEIAIRSRLGEKQSELAKEFGISQPAVSAIERGKTSVEENIVEEALNNVRDRALNKLMNSLGLITDEKLAKCNARDLATISSNLSKVVERTMPQTTRDGAGLNLIIFAPEIRREEKYKTVEV